MIGFRQTFKIHSTFTLDNGLYDFSHIHIKIMLADLQELSNSLSYAAHLEYSV